MSRKQLYSGYNHKRYAHFRNQSSGQYQLEDFKSSSNGKRMKPILKRVEVSFDELMNLNLDSYGVAVPTLETEDFTIVSNYLMDFWGAIMGNCAVDTYLHLKRHAYGKKDYCYVDIDLIALKMKRSKNTVKKYLDQLEEYGFIAIFHRMDKEDRGRDVSPLFKIRRYIPMITKDMYDSLNPKLQKLHDSFMSDLENVNLPDNFNETNNAIKDIVVKGKVLNSSKVKNLIDKSVEEGISKEFILKTIPKNCFKDNEYIHDLIQEIVSKPTYDVWFKNVVFFKQDSSLVAMFPTESSMEFMGESQLFYIARSLELENVILKTHEEYIEDYNRALN